MTAYYSNNMRSFLDDDPASIIYHLSRSDAASGFSQLSHKQFESWRHTIDISKQALKASKHSNDILGIVFEYRIPRREKRIDCAIIAPSDILLIEYKSGTSALNDDALEQGVDYGLDIVNYHEASRAYRVHVIICPTEYSGVDAIDRSIDKVASVQVCGKNQLARAIDNCVHTNIGNLTLDDWISSRYNPVPGILEAVNILFAKDNNRDINECLSSSSTLDRVVDYVTSQINKAKQQGKNKLLLISGVPGSGKTLVGLKLAHMTQSSADPFVYMSGNEPLLKVLKESLARSYSRESGCTLKEGRRHSEAMLHSVHAFIEERKRSNKPPIENVIIFHEAQRHGTLLRWKNECQTT